VGEVINGGAAVILWSAFESRTARQHPDPQNPAPGKATVGKIEVPRSERQAVGPHLRESRATLTSLVSMTMFLGTCETSKPRASWPSQRQRTTGG